MKRIAFFFILAMALVPPFPANAQDDPRTAQDQLIDLVGKAIVEETTQRSEEVRKAKDILDEILTETTTTTEQKEEAEKKSGRCRNRVCQSSKGTRHCSR
ncbi:MAG: hypothetical protein JEY79_12525 [Pseudodesulfovibrio sp.]|nr:hypothetical protein [Pseudodesulfovibrio sp.]